MKTQPGRFVGLAAVHERQEGSRAFKAEFRGTDVSRMAVRGSRREKSVYTFGLVGRVLWTLAGLSVLYFLLWPLVNLLRGGLINAGLGALRPLFFGVAGVILLIWVWPRFFRDVWKPASVAGDELTELRDQTRREAQLRERAPEQSEAVPLAQRVGPTRW